MGGISRYMKNAAILTLAGLILRASGMLLRVFVAGRIGAEGMGLYQVIFAVYSLFGTFATSGISVASTRLATEEMAMNGKNLYGIMVHTARFGCFLGLLAAVVQFSCAIPIAKYWLGDIRAVNALRILAFSLPFMAVCAGLKGFFYAKRKVTPNVKAQMLEQIVRISLIFFIISHLRNPTVETSCFIIVVGNTVSEISSCLLMNYYFLRETKQIKNKGPVQGVWRKAWKIAGPVEGGRCTDSGFHAVESALVPACLLSFLGSRAESLAQFGALKGMAMPILLFPFSFLSPLETLLLPEITQAHLQQKGKQMGALLNKIFFVSSVFSALVGGLITVHAQTMSEILYHDISVAYYLIALGPIVPAMYLDSIGDAVLKGLGEELAAFRYSCIDSILRIVLIIIIAPRYGIAGFLLVMLFSNFVSAILNIARIEKVTGVYARWWAWFIWPAAAFGMAAYLAHIGIEELNLKNIQFISMLIECFLTSVIYIIIIWLVKILKQNKGCEEYKNKNKNAEKVLTN